MVASEKARELVGAVKATGSRFGRASMLSDTRELTQAGIAMDEARDAALAYIARLEAVAEAARETIATRYGPFGEIRKALAGLGSEGMLPEPERQEIVDAITDFGQARYDLGIAAGENQSVPTQQALARVANRALRRALDLLDKALAGLGSEPGRAPARRNWFCPFCGKVIYGSDEELARDHAHPVEPEGGPTE